MVAPAVALAGAGSSSFGNGHVGLAANIQVLVKTAIVGTLPEGGNATNTMGTDP